MRFFVAITVGCIFCAGFALGQPMPAWATDATGKWRSDPELDRISHELDLVRNRYPWNREKIRALYLKHVVPHQQAFREARRVGTRLNNQDYFWSVALDAYFGELGLRKELKVPSIPEHLLQTVPFDVSVEFMRVAYCLYVRKGQPWITNTQIGHRLMKMWPDDALVMEAAITQFDLVGNKQEKLLALNMSELLLKRYPTQEERYLPRMPGICEGLRNITRDVKYQKMALAYYDRILSSTQPFFVRYREHYKMLRDDCVSVGKSFGFAGQ